MEGPAPAERDEKGMRPKVSASERASEAERKADLTPPTTVPTGDSPSVTRRLAAGKVKCDRLYLR